MGEYDWYSRSKLIDSLKLEDWLRKSDRTRVGLGQGPRTPRTQNEPIPETDITLSGFNSDRRQTKTGPESRPDWTRTGPSLGPNWTLTGPKPNPGLLDRTNFSQFSNQTKEPKMW